ncbi:MAG: aromatic ring-hydroxylating oxygenase subunit alpha [Acidimicrobiales bacterium]
MTTFHRTTESYRQGARTMSGEYYTSPEIYATERVRLGERCWFCVGRADALAEPGTYVLAAVAGESVVLVRDKKGTLRAFFNVCRHRGTRLLEAERGRLSETIQCPYHAWTYALDGRLIGAPHMNEIERFDKRDYPLHQAALAEWEGFLFVSVARAPEPLAGVLAPLVGRFGRFNLPRLASFRRVEYDVRANWKLVFQNFCECLHCPIIHPELARVLPYTSGANDLVEGPFLGGYLLIAEPHASATFTGRACGVPLGDLGPEDRRRAYYYTIFPNLMLSIHPDYAVYYTVWPEAVDRTRIVCEWLVHPDTLARPELDPEDAVQFWDTTNRQDWHISELSQAGIASRVYAPGPYSPRESVPAAWDRAYLEFMGKT